MRLIIGQKLNCNVSVFLMVMRCLFVFFKFCVVTVLTVPQCPPLTGTWPALRYEMTVFIPLRGPH